MASGLLVTAARVIVTGSRRWPDPWAVWAALADAYSGLSAGDALTVAHGAHWDGADRHAHIWARRMAAPGGAVRVIPAPYPAHWKRLGLKAGPLRNRDMVAAGADLVLAFPLADSIGTYGCMEMATAAGIPVLNYGVAC
ncbi:SLOG family protein [Nocardia sp. NPDC057030]|uniref:SLOG family protein n=1 Tax=unclassified Nocardia TaxID=2637762 RepID=UPI003630448F